MLPQWNMSTPSVGLALSYRITSYASALSAKSANDLYSSLLSTGLSDSSDAQSFASKLHSLVPRKSSKSKEAKPLPSAAERYSYLMDDEAESSTSRRKKVKKERDDGSVRLGRSVRKRDTEGNWEDAPRDPSPKRVRIESPPKGDGSDVPPEPQETEEQRDERERMEDLAERDAFAERIKSKDKDRTKRLVTDRTTGGEDAARRAALADDKEAREAIMEDLRLHSRQEYLSKREAQRLDLLKLEIEDEKMLFRNQKMSRREMEEFERKKELIRIMEQRQRIDDGKDGYMMPEDYITEQGRIDQNKRKNALYQRYEESKPVDGQFVTDVEQWELGQTDKTDMRTGAMDLVMEEEAYEYVFDESQGIQFLQEGEMEGTLTAEAQALLDQITQAEQKG